MRVFCFGYGIYYINPFYSVNPKEKVVNKNVCRDSFVCTNEIVISERTGRELRTASNRTLKKLCEYYEY